jgi:rhodanese-related sulfurtransferase
MEIDETRMREWLAEGPPILLDVREPSEVQWGHADGALLIPMRQVPTRLSEIPKDQRLVVYCAAGARSFNVTGFLREQGYSDAWSLAGGFGAYVRAGGAAIKPAT